MEQRDKKGFWFIILGVFFGNFVSLLNSGTVNVALPFIMRDLHTDVNTAQWVVTGFMLAMATTVPLIGYLGDKFSYKQLYVFSLIGLVVSSGLCGVSWNTGSLIAFRILQGLFSGMILPVTMTIIYQTIQKEKLPFAISLWSVAAMFAPAVGPTLGGLLTQYFGWKSIFFMNLPLGIIAIVFAIFFIPIYRVTKNTSLDVLGLISAVSGSVSLMMYFSQGNKIGWFSGTGVLWLSLGVTSIIVFVWRELTTKTPLLNIRLFKYPSFTFGTIVNSLINIGLYAGAFLVPIYMDNALHASSLTVGLVMFPGTVFMIVASLLAGKLYDKIQPVWLLLIGVFLLAIATWAFGHLTVATSYTFIVIWMIIRYIGLGLASPSITSLSMSVIPKDDTGHASSISNWLRSVFASFAIGIFSSYYSTRSQTHLAQLRGTSEGNSSLQSASVLGMNDTFMVATVIILVAIPFVLLFLKRKGAKEEKEEANKDLVVS